MPPINTNLSTITIKLNNILITGCYARPYLNMSNIDLDTIFNQGSQIMVIGDLNCKHITWNNNVNNKNGTLLNKYLIDNNLQILYTQKPTLIPYNNTTPSYIDVVLNKNITDLPDPQTLDELSSDHLPVLIKWKADVQTEQKHTKT